MSLITKIIELVLSLLNKEQFKELIDTILDKIEQMAVDSENKIDDAVVLPLCKKIRELLDVPDTDGIG